MSTFDDIFSKYVNTWDIRRDAMTVHGPETNDMLLIAVTLAVAFERIELLEKKVFELQKNITSLQLSD